MSTSVFDEGIDAFHDGKDVSENPYEAGTEEFSEWRLGWRTAYHDQEAGLEEEDD